MHSCAVARRASAAAQRILSGEDAAAAAVFAEQYRRLLVQLEKAVAESDANLLRHLVGRCLRSYAGKVVAAVRTIDEVRPSPASLVEIKALAGTLNPYRRISEPVRLSLQLKSDGKRVRPIFAFGTQRRTLQLMCWDLLKICLTPYPFDFMEPGRGGDSGGAQRLQELFEGGGYEYGVTVDIRDCFGSVRPEGLIASIPLPAPVVQHVLLVQDDVTVHLATRQRKGKDWKELNIPSLTLVDGYSLEQGTTARQGLPQGSKASNLIVSRQVIGPALASTSFTHRMVTFSDNITVAAKTEADAMDILQTLRSVLQSSPAGPLYLGHVRVTHITQGVDFCRYWLKRQPPWQGGEVRLTPSAKSFLKREQKIKETWKNSLPHEAEANTLAYDTRWLSAFPLWDRSPEADELLEYTRYVAETDAQTELQQGKS